MLRKCSSVVRQSVLIPQYSKILKRQHSMAFFEPPYLEKLKPKLPVHEEITVQIKGYDFPPLENFQKFAHSVAEFLNLKVVECWAHPARNYTITKFKPKSTVAETSYKLWMYERDIKLTNVPAVKLSLLAELLQTGLPPGTTLNILPFDPEHYKERFVPDHDLISKRKELDKLGGPPVEEHENPFFASPVKK